MAELKTKPTAASVDAFLRAIPDKSRRDDCLTVVKIMKQATKAEPEMWGPSIVGFGRFKYANPRGLEREWFLTGFSPRKNDLTLYIMSGFASQKVLLSKLGKYKTGVACLYLKRLADVDVKVLRQLIEASLSKTKSK
jgi:uncharacterized protein DUF1801